MTDNRNKLLQSDHNYFITKWCKTLEIQDERVRNAVDQIQQQIDLNLYALSLSTFIRAVKYARTLTENEKIKLALMVFYEKVPGWKNVRDFLEHFDDYAQGKGKLQKQSNISVYGPYYAEEERYDADEKLESKNYYLSFGEGNQIDIATATKEAVILSDVVFKESQNA